MWSFGAEQKNKGTPDLLRGKAHSQVHPDSDCVFALKIQQVKSQMQGGNKKNIHGRW